MQIVISDACIANICSKLRCRRTDIKSIVIGYTMFTVIMNSGAIGTVDYDIYDSTIESKS